MNSCQSHKFYNNMSNERIEKNIQCHAIQWNNYMYSMQLQLAAKLYFSITNLTHERAKMFKTWEACTDSYDKWLRQIFRRCRVVIILSKSPVWVAYW